MSQALATSDLAQDGAVAEILSVAHARRTLDLSDLSPDDQATLIAARSLDILPNVDTLASLIREANRPLVIKFGLEY